MLKRIVVVGLLASLAGSGCGPQEELESDPRAERLAAAKQALLPPSGPDLPPIDPCFLDPNACTNLFTNIHPTVGRGWNLISDQDQPSKLSCLQSYSMSAPSLTSPGVSSRVSFVSDARTIKDKLQLDARVSGGLPAADVPVSGSIYGNMSRTATATTSTVQLMVYSKVTYAPVRVTSVPKLTTGALAKFDTEGAVAFRNACGDAYVEEAVMGAELFGIIKISSSDTSLQSTLKAGISAGLGSTPTPAQAAQAVSTATNTGLNASFGADGSLTKTINGSQVTIEMEFFQNGGPLQANPISLQELINRFQNFPVTITSVSDLRVVGVGLKPYSQTSNFGTRLAFAMSDSSSALSRVLGPAYLAYLDAYNELAFALQHTGTGAYFPFNAANAAALMDEAALKILDIEELIESCGTGQGCTEQQVTAAVGTQWINIRSLLPVRRQLYVLTGQQFKSGTDGANVISTSTINWATAPAPCRIDTTLSVPGAVRIWTVGGVGGGNCTFRLFDGGELSGLWNVHSFNLELDSQSTLERAPTKADLTMRINVYSYPWYNGRAYLHGVTLAGPQGDPAAEPWRAAIRP